MLDKDELRLNAAIELMCGGVSETELMAATRRLSDKLGLISVNEAKTEAIGPLPDFTANDLEP